jgi:UDP-N-acetylglucosamine 1-carboxyvinyltransferase
MDKIEIQGGIKLKGEVAISGAKNAALPVMAASILCPGEHLISNVPLLRDISTMGKLLAHIGMGFHKEGDGPMLARKGEAKVSLPGGCAIGARPINLHTMGLKKMGAEIILSDGYIHARAAKLKGATIYFDVPTVTGTENLMMAAALADGVTILENAACEPEVVDLANALNSMGAEIHDAGTGVIKIKGVKELKPLDYRIVPDRIETGTFITAGAITCGNITINGCIPEHVEAVMNKLGEAGVKISQKDGSLSVRNSGRLKAVDIKTMPYPGFPTDMQAQLMALMSVAEGTSLITESIFENRFMHVAEMRRMGADIKVEGSTATVRGTGELKGAPVMATDLRASASLVVAGLAAKGNTVIDRVYHIDRGYEGIEEKLKLLGAKIRRIK